MQRLKKKARPETESGLGEKNSPAGISQTITEELDTRGDFRKKYKAKRKEHFVTNGRSLFD